MSEKYTIIVSLRPQVKREELEEVERALAKAYILITEKDHINLLFERSVEGETISSLEKILSDLPHGNYISLWVLCMLHTMETPWTQTLTSLIIPNRNLKRLPLLIGTLTQLTTLDLKGNDLEELPDSLGDLIHLENLQLDENPKLNLPNIFGTLSKLQTISLPSACFSSPHLSSLFSRFHIQDGQVKYSCRILTSYHDREIANAKLQALCTHIRPDQAKELKKLRLKDVSEIPANIERLTELESLTVSSGRLSLPESITKLRSLKALNLTFCKIEELPQSIGNLQQLKLLDIGYCGLERLPKSIDQLTSLQVLVLSSNPIQELPSSFGKLRSLRKLFINSTRITSLPLSIKEIPLDRFSYGRLKTKEGLHLFLWKLRGKDFFRYHWGKMLVGFGVFLIILFLSMLTIIVAHGIVFAIQAVLLIYTILFTKASGDIPKSVLLFGALMPVHILLVLIRVLF